MRRIGLALALGLVSTSPVWAVYGINTGPGSSDTTFSWVGQANGASGVIIDPHWVLTARHVGGSSFTLNGTNYTADSTFQAPNNMDLWLMHFANPFGGSYQMYSGPVIGQAVTLVGFGDTGTLRADNLGYTDVGGAGTRRSATNVVGQTQDLTVDLGGGVVLTTPCLLADLDAASGNNLASPWNRDWFGDGFASSNEGGLMSGDSGGGWFINDGGTWKLVGISNYIFWDDTVFPNESHFFEFGVSGSSAADLTAPAIQQWIGGTVPEPASMAALALGAIGLLARRRARR